MAIEGPLRELGIHDVFQLLDLSRKTGMLRISSDLREDEGRVFFDNGRVIQATIRSKSIPLEQVLLQAGRISRDDIAQACARLQTGAPTTAVVDELIALGAITSREIDRQLRLQVESAVFELMSWSDGFFSFEERSGDEMPRDTRIMVSTESLLMEGARRIDEWSRIADRVPHVGVIPELAPIADHAEGGVGPVMDLLPHEWQVLTMIDGERDLRTIAAAMGRGEFEIARIAYGLVTTDVIVLKSPAMRTPPSDPDRPLPETRMRTAKALMREGRHSEAVEELRRGIQDDPFTPELHRELGFAACRIGNLAGARASWEHFLRMAPGDMSASLVTSALECVARLQSLLEVHSDD